MKTSSLLDQLQVPLLEPQIRMEVGDMEKV